MQIEDNITAAYRHSKEIPKTTKSKASGTKQAVSKVDNLMECMNRLINENNSIRKELLLIPGRCAQVTLGFTNILCVLYLYT